MARRPSRLEHHELPSRSATLTRPNTFSTLNLPSSNFGTCQKNFSSQEVPWFGCISHDANPFGVADAPWMTASDLMETLQVQPAGATVSTPPTASVVSGNPTGDGSFAVSLGRVLGGTADLAEEGGAGASKASLALTRGKRTSSDNADSTSMAGVFLNYLVINLVQPAQSFGSKLNAEGSTLSSQSSPLEPDASATPNSARSPSVAVDELTSSSPTIASAGASGAAVVPFRELPDDAAFSTSYGWVGNGLGRTGTADRVESKSATRDEVSSPSSNVVSKPGQTQSGSSLGNASVSAPGVFQEFPSIFPLRPPIEPLGRVTRPESKRANAEGPRSVPEPGFAPEAQTARRSTSSCPQSGQVMQTNAFPGFSLAATVTSEAPFPDGHSHSVVQSTLHFAAAGGQQGSSAEPMDSGTQQASPEAGLQTDDSSTPLPSAEGTDGPEYSSFVEDLSGADLQGTNSACPTSSMGPGLATTPSGHRGSPVAESTTGSSDQTDILTMMGQFADTEFSVKGSENESRQAVGPGKSPTESLPEPGDTLGSGSLRVAVETPRPLAAPRIESVAAHAATGASHSLPTSSRAMTEGAGQKGAASDAASANLSGSPSPTAGASPSAEANSAAAQQSEASAQRSASSTTSPRGAASGGNGVQPVSPTSADSGGGAADVGQTDTSSTGRGKSGQNGQTSGNNPTNVITTATGLINNVTPDSAAGLLATHAPNPPAIPAHIPAPPNPQSSGQAPSTLSAWQNYDGGAGSIVRSASLAGSVNGAEMHVEFRSGVLGPMELHAVVNGGSIGAEIHVQGQEAHTLLAAGLPSLERALSERNLRVENISVYQEHSGGGTSSGEKQNQESGSNPSAQHQALPWTNSPQPHPAAGGSLDGEESTNPATGLSVRA